MNSPLISVVIPTHDRAHVIERAVDSVLAQTYKNWELIIVDDGSTDDTKKIISRYLSDHRVFYYYKENGGVSAARNFGIDKAQGDMIAFLDSDDEFSEKKLEVQIDLMQTYVIPISVTGRLVLKDGKAKKIHLSDTHVITKSEVINVNPPCSGTLMFSKELTKNVRFDEALSFGEDLDFLLRLMRSQKCLYVGLNLVRVHKTLKSDRLSTNWIGNIAGLNQLSANIASDIYNLTPSERQQILVRICWSLAIAYFLEADFSNTRTTLRENLHKIQWGRRKVEALFLYAALYSSVTAELLRKTVIKLLSKGFLFV